MKKTKFIRRMAVGLLALLVGTVAAFGQIDDSGQPSDFETYDPFLVTAEVLGISEEVLDSHLEDGKSIAQTARDLGFDPDIIVQAIRQADADETDAALASGEVDEAEAAEWRDYGYVFAVEFVYLPVEAMLWEEFEEFGEFANFEEFYGFDDSYYTFFPYAMAIETQRTMAYSLLDNGVEPEVVVDSILESEMSLLEQVLDFIVGLFIFDAWDDDYAYDDDFWEDEILQVITENLGIDEDTIWAALDGGQTLASLAQSHSVDPQVLIDLLMAEEEEWITEFLADGDLTESEAEEWRAESLELVQEIVNEPWF